MKGINKCLSYLNHLIFLSNFTPSVIMVYQNVMSLFFILHIHKLRTFCVQSQGIKFRKSETGYVKTWCLMYANLNLSTLIFGLEEPKHVFLLINFDIRLTLPCVWKLKRVDVEFRQLLSHACKATIECEWLKLFLHASKYS